MTGNGDGAEGPKEGRDACVQRPRGDSSWMSQGDKAMTASRRSGINRTWAEDLPYQLFQRPDIPCIFKSFDRFAPFEATLYGMMRRLAPDQ
jgi:hypothetical protein